MFACKMCQIPSFGQAINITCVSFNFRGTISYTFYFSLCVGLLLSKKDMKSVNLRFAFDEYLIKYYFKNI